MPAGVPKHVRCYDNGGADAKPCKARPDGGSLDRYTVVFTNTKDGICHYLAMNCAPFHPQGIGMHGENQNGMIDRPAYSHLGRKITFQELPEDCRRCVLQDYREIWRLK